MGSTFTQADINSGIIKYERNTYSSDTNDPDAPEYPADSFKFTVNDDGKEYAKNPAVADPNSEEAKTFTFDISVQDLNEAPYFATESDPANEIYAIDNGVMIDVGQGEDIVLWGLKDGEPTILYTDDPDTTDTPEHLTYTLTNAPDYGSLYLGSTLISKDGVIVGNTTFTQADVNNGELRYLHNGDETHTEDTLKFTVNDDGGLNKYGTSESLKTSELTLVMNVINFNDQPVVDVNKPLTVFENTNKNGLAITDSYLLSSDDDTTDTTDELTYILVEKAPDPAKGYLYLDEDGSGSMDGTESAMGIGSTFTQTHVKDGKVKYAPNPTYEPDNDDPNSFEDSFKFTLSDDGGKRSDGSLNAEAWLATHLVDGTETNTFTFNINIKPENESPIITKTASFEMGTRDDYISNKTITTADLNADDPDFEDDSTKVTYTLTQLPSDGVTGTTDGTLYLDLNNDNIIDSGEALNTTTNKTFTQAQIDSDSASDSGLLKYRYTNQPAATTKVDFKFSVSDGHGGTTTEQTFNIKVPGSSNIPTIWDKTPVPTLSLTVDEGANAAQITSKNSYFYDFENGVDVTYEITSLPKYGTLFLDKKDPVTGLYNGILDDGEGVYASQYDADGKKTDDGQKISQKTEIYEARHFYYVPNTEIGTEDAKTPDQFTFIVRDPDGQATESNPDGKETFNITINGVNDGPDLATAVNTGIGQGTGTVPNPIDEDSSKPITAAMLKYTDPDYADDKQPAAGIVYTVKTLDFVYDYGTYLFIDSQKAGEAGDGVYDSNDTKIAVNGTFTQSDINDGDLIYQNAGETKDTRTQGDSFSFTVKDGDPGAIETAKATFKINWTPNANDDPIIGTNSVLEVQEGKSKQIQAELVATDQDDIAANLTYSITDAPNNGRLYLDNDGVEGYNSAIDTLIASPSSLSPTGNIQNTFTQKDITDDGKLWYQHDGTNTTSDSFTFSVKDDGIPSTTNKDGILDADATFNITVTPENDSPVLTVNSMNVTTGQTNAPIGKTQLDVKDELVETNQPDQLTYTITALGTTDNPFSGTLYKTGKPLVIGTDTATFTQADINAGNVLTFSHDGKTYDATETFNFTVEDNDTTNPETKGVFTINVSGPRLLLQIKVKCQQEKLLFQ